MYNIDQFSNRALKELYRLLRNKNTYHIARIIATIDWHQRNPDKYDPHLAPGVMHYFMQSDKFMSRIAAFPPFTLEFIASFSYQVSDCRSFREDANVLDIERAKSLVIEIQEIGLSMELGRGGAIHPILFLQECNNHLNGYLDLMLFADSIYSRQARGVDLNALFQNLWGMTYREAADVALRINNLPDRIRNHPHYSIFMEKFSADRQTHQCQFMENRKFTHNPDYVLFEYNPIHKYPGLRFGSENGRTEVIVPQMRLIVDAVFNRAYYDLRQNLGKDFSHIIGTGLEDAVCGLFDGYSDLACQREFVYKKGQHKSPDLLIFSSDTLWVLQVTSGWLRVEEKLHVDSFYKYLIRIKDKMIKTEQFVKEIHDGTVNNAEGVDSSLIAKMHAYKRVVSLIVTIPTLPVNRIFYDNSPLTEYLDQGRNIGGVVIEHYLCSLGALLHFKYLNSKGAPTDLLRWITKREMIKEKHESDKDKLNNTILGQSLKRILKAHGLEEVD